MSHASDRLKKAQEALGIEAKKSLGQNFLVSDVVINRIIDRVKELAPEHLIEVGPGPGALTDLLLDFKIPLQLIELDHAIAAYWRDKGLPVVEEDALRLDWSQFFKAPNTVLVSNLPYQISSSIVIDRCMDVVGADHMVLMFQKEVAQRIRALPTSDNYGFLSVIAQTFWKIHTVSEAGPGDFNPPPRVASRVLGFSRIPSPIVDRRAFLSFVKVAYAQRRKLLKKNLGSIYKERQITEEQVVQWLKDLGFKETVRAEELSPVQMVHLFKKFGFN